MDHGVLLCKAINMGGDPCNRHSTPGMEVCWWHHPERMEERARRLEAQAAQVRASVVVQ